MKHMKKSMFITTLAMVVVLVVALSTATFAWYTAQTSATVTSTTVTSAGSSTASLVIDASAAASNTANNSTITLAMRSATSQANPLMLDLAAAPTSSTTYASFKTAFVNFTVDNSTHFASVPATAQQGDIITSVTDANTTTTTPQDNFVITNVGGAATGVTAKVTIDPISYVSQGVLPEGASVASLYTYSAGTYSAANGTADGSTTYYKQISNAFLRVAMFVDGNYVNTWAYDTTNKAVKYADYTGADSTDKEIGDALLATSTYNASVSEDVVNIKASLSSMGHITIQLVAWFEGDSHTNAYAASASSFAISFGTVAAA